MLSGSQSLCKKALRLFVSQSARSSCNLQPHSVLALPTSSICRLKVNKEIVKIYKRTNLNLYYNALSGINTILIVFVVVTVKLKVKLKVN